MWETNIEITEDDCRDDKTIYDDYLKKYFNQNLKSFEYDINEWETTPDSGYWLPTHNHGHSQFTIVRYVDVDGFGGELIIQDPRPNANRNWPGELGNQFAPLVVEPKTGMTVIFPSFCYHLAAPFRGRIRKTKVSEIELYSRSKADDTKNVSPI